MSFLYRQCKCVFRICVALSAAVQLAGCRVPSRPSPKPAVMHAHDYARLLGRGINLGNALEGPAEGAWGVTIRPEHFTLIREAGFDSVRIPIRWSAHADNAPPYTVSEDFFRRIDEVVQMALEQNFAVVINIHHYEEIMKKPAEHLPRFLALWRQIGARYKNHPDTLSFELLNEPTDNLTAELWNEYLQLGIDVVRETNPDRVLIIGTAEWGGLRALEKLEIPEEEHNLIVTFHYYEPFPFTHQGAEWIRDSNPWLGTTWKGTAEQRQAVIRDMERTAQWADARNRPLYMGEFGAYRKADMESRVRWTTVVAREAKARGIPWAYWEFCSGFGVYDAREKAWRAPLLGALIPR